MQITKINLQRTKVVEGLNFIINGLNFFFEMNGLKFLIRVFKVFFRMVRNDFFSRTVNKSY